MVAPSLFLLSAALALASASPVARRQGGSCTPRPPPGPPVLPKTGNVAVEGESSELEGPPEGVVLKHIALGQGIQNYTCTISGPDVTANATGALAVLYDVTGFYPGSPGGVRTLAAFESMPRNALFFNDNPIVFDESLLDRLLADHPGASLTAPFPEPAPLQLFNLEIPYLGVHFFDSNGVPNFAVGDGELFHGALDAAVPPPAAASDGPDGQAAVKWLRLKDREGLSRGISFVFRVTTVGGSSQLCETTGDNSVPYTAYYWMYGPPDA